MPPLSATDASNIIAHVTLPLDPLLSVTVTVSGSVNTPLHVFNDIFNDIEIRQMGFNAVTVIFLGY